MDARGNIESALASALMDADLKGFKVTLEHPAELSRGDYATGIALAKAKEAGMNSRALAEKIVAGLGEIIGVEKIEIAGPGFINFTLTKEVFAEVVEKARTEDMWGRGDAKSGKKIMVEYTDPNPFKEFHIGHLMSNAIGESVSRLFQFEGAEIKRANYQGDVGPHVAKAVWGVQKLGADANNAEALGQAYAAGAKAYEDDAAANLKVVNAVTRDGQRWISETKVNGRSVIRMMVISYLTESRHLIALQKALTEAAEELSTSRK